MSDKPKKVPKIEKSMPGFFKPKYSIKQFEAKILKRIYIPREREHILNFYEKKSEGYFLRQEYLDKKKSLTKKEFQRLDNLGKSIKKNGSMVDWFKVVLVGGLTAGVLVIISFFLPGWTAGLIQGSLEGIFEARADLRGFSLDLLGGSISFENLAIADKSNPMQNIFEMDQAGFALNVEELASGRYHIESLKVEGLRWGTARSYSGALVNAGGSGEGTLDNPQGQGGAGEENPDEGIFGAFGGGESAEILPKEITDLNPETLLEAQYEKLETPVVLEEANEFYESVSADYTQRVETVQTELEEFQASAQVILDTDLARVDSLIKVNQLISDLETLQRNFDSVSRSVGGAAEQGRQDWEEVLTMKEKVTGAFASDQAFLEGLVSLPLTGENSLASTLILNPIKSSLGNYYTLGKMGLDFLQSLPKKEDPAEEIPREGRDITVPVPGKPVFLMKDVSFSLGQEGNEGYHSVDVNNLSSDQELWPQPMSIFYEGQVEGKQLSLGVIQDGLNDRLSLNIQAGGFDFDLSEGFDALGIGALRGQLAVSGNWVYDGQTASSLDLRVQFLDIVPTYVDRGEITNLVRGIFSAKKDFLLTLTVRESEEGLNLDLGSDADRIIGDTISRWINDQVSAAREELMGAFDKSIEDLVGENDALAAEIDGLLATLEGGEDSLRILETQMAQKKTELENRAIQFAADNLIPENITIPNFGF